MRRNGVLLACVAAITLAAGYFAYRAGAARRVVVYTGAGPTSVQSADENATKAGFEPALVDLGDNFGTHLFPSN